MVTKPLAEILKRVETWPEEVQEEAAASLESIERELLEPYELTDDDKAAIERGLDDLRNGRLMPDAKVAELFARYRK
jgi:predicted transcriptional regulator